MQICACGRAISTSKGNFFHVPRQFARPRAEEMCNANAPCSLLYSMPLAIRQQRLERVEKATQTSVDSPAAFSSPLRAGACVRWLVDCISCSVCWPFHCCLFACCWLTSSCRLTLAPPPSRFGHPAPPSLPLPSLPLYADSHQEVGWAEGGILTRTE